MIDIESLMIGNIIAPPPPAHKPAELLIVKSISVSKLTTAAGPEYILNGSFYARDCSPIPLTSELMERLRWLPDPAADTSGPTYRDPIESDLMVKFFKTKLRYMNFKAGDIIFRRTDPNNIGTIKQLLYLHELQNHYRWETGKNLELNLDQS